MFGSSGKVVRVEGGAVFHSVLSDCGQSGSPIWLRQDGHTFLVALHLGVVQNSGLGLLITKKMLLDICRWEKEMTPSALRFSQEPSSETQSLDLHFALEDYQELERDATVKPLLVEWEVPADNRDRLQVEGNRIIRRQLSLFDDSHRQITSRLPLPQRGVHSLRFKVVRYGQPPHDAIYFGILTAARKSLPNSDGRQQHALAYCSAPSGFGTAGEGVGAVLVEGRQVAYGEGLFVREGGEVRVRVAAESGEVVWENGREEVAVRWEKCGGGREAYLFVSMSCHLATVSWKSQDSAVWE